VSVKKLYRERQDALTIALILLASLALAQYMHALWLTFWASKGRPT